MLLLLVLVNGGILLVTYAVMPQSNGWALFGGWLLNLLLIVVVCGGIGSKLRGNGAPIFLIILFAVYSLVYSVMGGQLPRLFRLRETPIIPARDADLEAYRNADVFHFSDGRVDLKQAARRVLSGRGRRVHYRVAPLLPPDWKRDDPIPAWVADSGLEASLPASWTEDYRGGFDAGFDSTYRDLVIETAQQRSLRTSRTCPILIWSAAPRDDFRRWGFWQLGFLLAIDMVGFGSLLWPSRARSPAP